MKPPDLSTIPEKDFEVLPQWAKDYLVVPEKPSQPKFVRDGVMLS